MRATTAQLYPGQDTSKFDKGHVTKNQLITVLVLLSESLELYNNLTCLILSGTVFYSTVAEHQQRRLIIHSSLIHINFTIYKELDPRKMQFSSEFSLA